MQEEKITLNISKSVLDLADAYAKNACISTHDLLVKAIEDYLFSLTKEGVKLHLKEGDEKMGALNLELAEMYFNAENEAFFRCEEKLSESD